MGKSEHQRNRLFLPQICCFLDSRNDLHYHQNHAIDTSSTRARKQSNIIHSRVLQSTSMSTWYIKHDLWFDLSSFQVLSLNLTLGNNWSAEYLLRQAPGNEKCDAGDAAPPHVSYFWPSPQILNLLSRSAVRTTCDAYSCCHIKMKLSTNMRKQIHLETYLVLGWDAEPACNACFRIFAKQWTHTNNPIWNLQVMLLLTSQTRACLMESDSRVQSSRRVQQKRTKLLSFCGLPGYIWAKTQTIGRWALALGRLIHGLVGSAHNWSFCTHCTTSSCNLIWGFLMTTSKNVFWENTSLTESSEYIWLYWFGCNLTLDEPVFWKLGAKDCLYARQATLKGRGGLSHY